MGHLAEVRGQRQITPTPVQNSVLTLRDICRIKGQEENTLQGVGLVVGLKGTGDAGNKPTLRSLARMTQILGGNIGFDSQGLPDLTEIEDTKNVAQVLITAKIPASGAQQGDTLDCQISAISASSLEGGQLVTAAMVGPRADAQQIYALAQGTLSLPDSETPTSAIVYGGCKMEATVRNSFVSEGKITLIIDSDLDGFSNVGRVQDAINSYSQAGLVAGDGTTGSTFEALAIDQHHVEVSVPKIYQANPVSFVILLLELRITNLKQKKRVMINEREGVIVVGEDVLINPVAITHRNLSIEAGAAPRRFASLDTRVPEEQAKLQDLVTALNKVNVATDDMIAIIRTLDRGGHLFGEVVFY